MTIKFLTALLGFVQRELARASEKAEAKAAAHAANIGLIERARLIAKAEAAAADKLAGKIKELLS